MEGFFVPLFFFLFLLHVPVHAADDICAHKDCGKGTCVPDGTFLGPGFSCECYPGWNKIQLGPLTFPSCVVPNCTLDFGCGGSAPPPPPLPPPAPFNPFNPCNFVWCGEGTCVVDGTGYYCKCYEGYANLFNLSTVACFKSCSFGADCRGIGLGPPVTPPPPPPPNGSDTISKKSGSYDGFNMLLLSAVILALIM